MMLRKIDPGSVEGDSSATGVSSQERANNLGQISQLIKDNPDVFKEVIRAWAGVDAPAASAEETTQKKVA